MASPSGRGGRRAQIQRAAHTARRAWPYVMMAWERWQALTPEQRERYIKHAREAADRIRRGGGGGGTGRGGPGRFPRKR